MTLFSIALLIVAGYYWRTYRNIDEGVTKYQVNVGMTPRNAVHEFNGKDQNILLVGNDDRETMTNQEMKDLGVGRDGGSLATDTMMIVHIPADGKKATLISLPRDTWVSIKNFGMGKLNSAYADAYTESEGTLDQKRLAGANSLIDTVSKLTGLTIDHYIQVDLLGFYRISNAIGGVPVTLCNNVDDTKARNLAAGLSGGSGLKLSKGTHLIHGRQALRFVRQRHFLPNGDLDRVRRQQYFLTAAFRKVASAGILFKLNALGDAITRSIFTDKSLNLISLGKQLENLTAGNIVGKTIPTTFGTANGQSVLLVNTAQVKRFVSRVINPPVTSSTGGPTTAAPSTSASKTTAGTSASTSASTSAIDSKCIN